MLASRFALHRRATTLCLVLFLAMGATGCGIFSPDETDTEGPPVESYPVATTPDKLIENLERAYRERSKDEYAKLLDTDFEFFFAEEDIQDIEQESWFRQAEINATERMFSGQPSSEGEAIQSITITLTPLGSGGWTDDVPTDFTGSVTRSYCVNMDVTAGETVFQVRGLQRFFAVQREVDGNLVYMLLGWEDFGTTADCQQ